MNFWSSDKNELNSLSLSCQLFLRFDKETTLAWVFIKITISCIVKTLHNDLGSIHFEALSCSSRFSIHGKQLKIIQLWKELAFIVVFLWKRIHPLPMWIFKNSWEVFLKNHKKLVLYFKRIAWKRISFKCKLTFLLPWVFQRNISDSSSSSSLWYYNRTQNKMDI